LREAHPIWILWGGGRKQLYCVISAIKSKLFRILSNFLKRNVFVFYIIIEPGAFFDWTLRLWFSID
jgi:hypothetical protein